ncbi:MAG: TraR/DksA family transcriptional regulator [Candidatus Pacebacteria bacterium]|nr:TraR/DksA family transcriptional regulator [Candidatus Paceibacterota bacterium]MBP9842419.1 TraR/DksA family transcriptional regulator [Candidatus Paceibacterota bacterium]
MVLDVKVQEQMIHARLAYYESVIPKRDVSYGSHKIRKIIPRLRRALQKISEGSYGICDDCYEEIPLPRLQSIPGATQCVNCKAAEE